MLSLPIIISQFQHNISNSAQARGTNQWTNRKQRDKVSPNPRLQVLAPPPASSLQMPRTAFAVQSASSALKGCRLSGSAHHLRADPQRAAQTCLVWEVSGRTPSLGSTLIYIGKHKQCEHGRCQRFVRLIYCSKPGQVFSFLLLRNFRLSFSSASNIYQWGMWYGPRNDSNHDFSSFQHPSPRLWLAHLTKW